MKRLHKLLTKWKFNPVKAIVTWQVALLWKPRQLAKMKQLGSAKRYCLAFEFSLAFFGLSLPDFHGWPYVLSSSYLIYIVVKPVPTLILPCLILGCYQHYCFAAYLLTQQVNCILFRVLTATFTKNVHPSQLTPGPHQNVLSI